MSVSKEVIRILDLFPYLISRNNFKIWSGLITVEDEEVAITIITPHFPSIDNFSVICPIALEKQIKMKLSCYQKVANHKESQLLHLLEYLRCGQSIGSRKTTSSEPNVSFAQRDYLRYNRILNELKQLDSGCIMACNTDLTEITLRVHDDRAVEHLLVIGVTLDYPSVHPTVIKMDMPEIASSDLCQADSITEMFRIFKSLVDEYQDFWDAYNSLVKNTWVIDPEHPTLKDTYCRIIIGENVSIVITLNPQDVNTCPDIKFLGPENAISPFINSLEKNLKSVGWNEDSSVLDNLLTLLDLPSFPVHDTKSETAQEQDECSICFLVRLDDQLLPTKVCNNPKCSSYFHISCLAQWFQAVPTNETTFNLISGECPCCGEKILCPVKVS